MLPLQQAQAVHPGRRGVIAAVEAAAGAVEVEAAVAVAAAEAAEAAAAAVHVAAGNN